MTRVTNRQAIEKIAKREEFENNNGTFKGYWVKNIATLPRRWKESDTGRSAYDMLNVNFLGVRQDVYVVTSYDVVIAMFTGRSFSVTNDKWSVTTSKHTNFAAQGFARAV